MDRIIKSLIKRGLIIKEGDKLKVVETLLPPCLLTGLQGKYKGHYCNIPSFDPISLLDSYYNNDPSRLKLNGNLELIDEGGLESLWEDGEGILSFKPIWEKKGLGYVLYGEHNVRSIDKWLQLEYILIDKQSDKIIITRQRGVKKISDLDIERVLKNLPIKSQKYKINLYQNKSLQTISIKSWLEFYLKGKTKEDLYLFYQG